MRCITDVIPFFMNDVYPTNKDCVVSDIDLEEPYCIEVSKETFDLLLRILNIAYNEINQHSPRLCTAKNIAIDETILESTENNISKVVDF